MATDEPFLTTDKMLAGMNFAAMSAEQDRKHRAELESVLRRFLVMVDSLERLEEHCRELDEAGGGEVPVKSVGVIVKQAMRELSGAGVTPMNPVGSFVDLDRHEVVATRPDPDHEEGTVLEEHLRGYLWRERVLRQSKVVVAQPEPETDATTVSEEEHR